jgi:DNA-binding transcriptional MerR regulator
VKAVARLTGIRPELLRMWERRYELFKPQRAGNRYREYDDEDLQLLRHIRQQIEQGRSIGELAAEGREALLRQIKAPPRSESISANRTDSFVDELLGYICRLDKERLEVRLAEIIAFTSCTILFTTVLPPLMHRLGTAWVCGEAPIVSGYFATEVFKQRLLALLQVPVPAAEAPVLVCACPGGEAHELGLLTFAYTMQQRGWQVYYMGANLPVFALAEGCQRLHPALVTLSLTYSPEPDYCLSVLHEIDTQLAAIYPTCVGGQAIEQVRHQFQPSHLMLCDGLSAAHQRGQHLYTATRTLR